MRKFNIKVNGTAYEVEVEEIGGAVSSAPVASAPVSAPAAAPAPKAEAPKAAAPSGSAGSVKVEAPMPGTVLRVNVNVGDTVEEGQAVVILEAMKMEKFDEKEYDELIERLFKRFPSYQTVGGNAYHPGLENMMEFDSRLGHPHRNYKSVHVAGTNGKGSVSNMLAAALAAMGYKVGLYTSPHLLDFRERARIVGQGLIPQQDVLEFCTRWWPVFDELNLSFFEITTALSFWWFAKEGVDFAVIETGLGGRLDSTNIISPQLSVITNIGLDHCNILGDTISKIAAEKAGIIKSETPVVIGESGEDSDLVFKAKAAKDGADISFADKDFQFSRNTLAALLEELDLHGCYQKKNLPTALAALTVLHRKGIIPKSATSPLILDALKHTAERTGFHGRWEKVCDSPLTIVDIGHNQHGLKYNFAQLF